MTKTTAAGEPAGRRRGRPRAFDREAALDRAMWLFWEHGYEATSIAELTSAMGIGAPSLYAAFGDKKSLFLAAVETYRETYGVPPTQALLQGPTARDGVTRMLRTAATLFTEPGRPRGCLVISAATNCTAGSADVEQRLREQRNANVDAIEQLIRADVEAGVLPPQTRHRQLAVFVAATFQGMSQQARDGASRDDLLAVAETAMLAWPTQHPPTQDPPG